MSRIDLGLNSASDFRYTVRVRPATPPQCLWGSPGNVDALVGSASRTSGRARLSL